jgi:acyl-homoserine-lactone acylase
MRSFNYWQSLLIILVIALSSFSLAEIKAPAGTEILWDTWSVPHIFAESEAGAFYAYGWAQAQNHGELILKLYAQARGRAAEIYGETFLESDKAVRLIRIPERAQEWFTAQRPEFRSNLEAFASGFNAYLAEHPTEFSEEARSVLPVTVTDLLAHTIRDLSLFIASECSSVVPGLALGGQPGSNGWAIAPSHSESGNALLLANPHLGWSGMTLFFEAQLETPTASIYGVSLVGVPVPTIAFNDRLGWTHTTNTHDGCDLFALTPEANGYRFDGEVVPFEIETQIIQVKQPDGTLQELPFEIKRSLHGPVVLETDDMMLAMRMVGVDVADYPGLLEQWWDMAKSQNLNEFEAVLARNQLPSQNVIYADANGETMQLFAGRVPVRSTGDSTFWRTPVAGDTSDLLWTEIHPYEDLPKAVNPEAGWVQNSNSAPWYMTSEGAPRPEDFPAYLSPVGPVNVREQRGIELLESDESISFEELVRYKHDTFSLLANRLRDDLLAVVQDTDNESLGSAVQVLSTWDGHMEKDSRGAALFYLWFMNYFQASLEQAMKENPSLALDESTLYSDIFYSTPWTAEKPTTTPDGIANPALAVAALESAATTLQGQLDLPWGDIARMRFGNADVPASGGPGELGVFRVAEVAPDTDGRYRTIWGDSYVAIVEFSNPVKAQVLTTYGNSSQTSSVHAGDQLSLATEQKLRPVWLEREEITLHLQEQISW